MTNPPTPKEFRSTSLRLLVGLPIVGLIWTSILRAFSESQEMNWYVFGVFAFVGLAIGTPSLLFPAFGRITYLAWHSFIKIFDQIIIWITLPFFYLLIFSPYCILIRLFGKSKFKKRTKPASSYWKNIEQPESNRRYIQQF